MRAAENAEYNVLLTVDQGIQYQLPATGQRLSALIIRCRTNRMQDVLPAFEQIVNVLETIQPGQTAFVIAPPI